MRIWFPLIRTDTGAEVYARQLAHGLTALGHEVQLDAIAHRYQYAPWLAGLRVPEGTDVTLANSWSAAAFAGAAPLVTVVHHVVHDPALAPFKTLPQAVFHRLFVLPMERTALRRSAAVIAVSGATRDAVGAFLGRRDVDVVLNGVDTDFFRPGTGEMKRSAAAPIELLFVGKPSRRKGFDLVGEIVARLGQSCRLTCVGPPPEMGITCPPGRYLGRVSREVLRDAYRQADVLVFPSRLEGFGYAAAEAMACGLPVACLEGGAVAEIVAPPTCGLDAPAGDAGRLAEGIAQLCHDPGRMAAMRRAARARAVQHLDRKRWISEILAILERAAGSIRRARAAE